MNCVPYVCVYLWKFLQGVLRILAQVLERFDLGSPECFFILLLLKLQATGTNCGRAIRHLHVSNVQLWKKKSSSTQETGKIEIWKWSVNWKNQVTNFWDNKVIGKLPFVLKEWFWSCSFNIQLVWKILKHLTALSNNRIKADILFILFVNYVTCHLQGSSPIILVNNTFSIFLQN